MSKEEDELEEILENLKRFVNRRKGHAIAVIIHPPSDKEAKKFYIAGYEVNWLITGNTAITLGMIRHKFRKMLKQLEEKDKAVARDIEKRKEKRKAKK